jgi:hypothetical protein
MKLPQCQDFHPVYPNPHSLHGVADFKDVFGRETEGFTSKNIPLLSNAAYTYTNLKVRSPQIHPTSRLLPLSGGGEGVIRLDINLRD